MPAATVQELQHAGQFDDHAARSLFVGTQSAGIDELVDTLPAAAEHGRGLTNRNPARLSGPPSVPLLGLAEPVGVCHAALIISVLVRTPLLFR